MSRDHVFDLVLILLRRGSSIPKSVRHNAGPNSVVNNSRHLSDVLVDSHGFLVGR